MLERSRDGNEFIYLDGQGNLDTFLATHEHSSCISNTHLEPVIDVRLTSKMTKVLKLNAEVVLRPLFSATTIFPINVRLGARLNLLFWTSIASVLNVRIPILN